jgi:hypothetical protein
LFSFEPNQKIVISTEAARAFCEQRSGEIRFYQTNSFHCLYHPRKVFFAIFSPKNACQALKPPNPLKQNEIELAF